MDKDLPNFGIKGPEIEWVSYGGPSVGFPWGKFLLTICGAVLLAAVMANL